MSLKKDIEKSKFLVFLLDEDHHIDEVVEVTKSLKNKDSKICYVCLSRTFDDVCGDFEKKGMDLKRFYFIDVLSSHYGKKKNEKNCLFLDSPTNIQEIKRTILTVLKEKKCNTLILDTISAMLVYHDARNIEQFTNDILLEEQNKEKIIYMAFKHNLCTLPHENEMLINDLNMFADKMIDISLKKASK
ncbi:MAG: hypothetical protein ABIF85_01540 [Nanoarchaeota archaeon]|nr:hypothetical protein [Nanoarchaeota archaeon]MBU4299737.1 hypothetical protein [Nanoarchaeota archaeon]MBU4452551.1 hypothetical protein [Nanoarchaeota archaeon]MCG2723516.1 hypothetical protein [archaeon]